jgi:hypothetical protein
VTVDEFTRLAWRVVDEPVLRPPPGSPIVADPTFLLPHDTPDGRWHLFAHSTWGVHHFTSADGLAWSKPRLAVRHAMRAYVLRDGTVYHLFYERYPAFRLPLTLVPGLRWRSWIEHRTSFDLATWSAPRVALRPTLGWHRTQGLGAAVGNPTVLPGATSGWTLYYSAALVRVPDCGFNEPVHVGIAHADAVEGPYRPEPSPVLSPRHADPRANLGAGALRVLRLDDGFVGLQNGIAWDAATGRSSSALSVRTSQDGQTWTYAHDEPIIRPSAETRVRPSANTLTRPNEAREAERLAERTAWRARFVYACDARRDLRGRWYLYFNGRDRAPLLKGREAIGLAVADPA